MTDLLIGLGFVATFLVVSLAATSSMTYRNKVFVVVGLPLLLGSIFTTVPVIKQVFATPENRVEIIAKQYSFEVRGRAKAGVPVEIVTTSSDVTHGVMIRDLGVNLQSIPRRENRVVVVPPKAGRFEILCVEYCDLGHGFMKGVLVVEN